MNLFFSANFAAMTDYLNAVRCLLRLSYVAKNKTVASGAGKNLKVGPKFFVVPLHFFDSKSSPVSRFGERFRDGQYSLVSFLFAVLVLTVPACSATDYVHTLYISLLHYTVP